MNFSVTVKLTFAYCTPVSVYSKTVNELLSELINGFAKEVFAPAASPTKAGIVPKPSKPSLTIGADSGIWAKP